MRFRSSSGLAAIVTAAALALTGCGGGSGTTGTATNADGKVDGTGKTLNVLVNVY
jgi:multiple sugar transport system substrate-binding protein